MSNPVGRRRHSFRRDHVDAVTLVFFTTPSMLFSFLEVGPDLPLRTLICALICTLYYVTLTCTDQIMGTPICQASIEATNGNVTSFTPLNVELLVISL